MVSDVSVVEQRSPGTEVADMCFRVYRGGGGLAVRVAGNKGTVGGRSIWQHCATFPGGSFT